VHNTGGRGRRPGDDAAGAAIKAAMASEARELARGADCVRVERWAPTHAWIRAVFWV